MKLIERDGLICLGQGGVNLVFLYFITPSVLDLFTARVNKYLEPTLI